MNKCKLVPMEPTPEMVEAAQDAYMPFGDMDSALRMALLAAPDHTPDTKKVSRAQIREVFMRNGFTIKPGCDDLREYVYEAAFELLQTVPAEQGETLADQMRAAGMLTIDEMLNKAPLDGFIRHAGVHDLDSYGHWLDKKCREFLTMQAKRELDKDPVDDMYEWVIAHAAAFQEARINFNAARPAEAEQQPGITQLVEALLKARSAVATLAGIRDDRVREGDEEHARALYALLAEIDDLATYHKQENES